MRKSQKAALRSVATRAGIKLEQLDEVCLVASSTAGPLVIGALIERGLEIFRKAQKPKRK